MDFKKLLEKYFPDKKKPNIETQDKSRRITVRKIIWAVVFLSF